MTHICVVKQTIIGSDNGLSPGRRQTIIWTNAGILLIGPLGTNFIQILVGIQTFSFKKMHLKMSSAKWRPFCLGLNVLSVASNYCALFVCDKIHKINHIMNYAQCNSKFKMCLGIAHLSCYIETMMTSSSGNIFRVSGPLCGESTGHRWIPRTKASDVELWYLFYLRLNKRLSKQLWRWWFETLSCSLWRHCNDDQVCVLLHMRCVDRYLWGYTELTHLPLALHICVSESDHNWFR